MLVKYWASIAGYVAVSMPFLLQLPHTTTPPIRKLEWRPFLSCVAFPENQSLEK